MNKNIDINIVLLNNDAKIPQKQHDSDIGYDIYSVKNYNITPKKVTKVKTGVSIELPEKYGGFILPRSGLASNHSITSINSPGLVDPGYTGELVIPLFNHSDENYKLDKGERFAQLVIINVENITFNTVTQLKKTERSNKGFGSTG
ncbi:MAG: dUTP diphosphatase [Candidatus Actinomarina sp.]